MTRKFFVMLGFALMLAAALPTHAWAVESPGALQVATQGVTAIDDTSYVYDEGQEFYQATNTSIEYDVGYLMTTHDYYYYGSYENVKTSVFSVTGSGTVTCTKVDGQDSRFKVVAKKAGKVVITLEETWDEVSYDYDDETYEEIRTVTPHSEQHSFVVRAISLKNMTGKLSKCVQSTYASEKFTFKLSGLPADADVQLVKDSNKKGSSYINKISAGKVTLTVYGLGTHTIKLKAYGKTITCKAVLRQLSLKQTADVKDTGSLVAYPGMKSQLVAKVTGVKNPKVAWSSTNTSIATVSKKGVVKAKGIGRCYVKAKVGKATLKVLVEVTTPGAYQAVRNAFEDMRKNLSYSQAERMSSYARDCSSFVSRCYWDDSLGRYIFAIGGYDASNWAYNAAAQANWLNDNGYRVSWSACSEKKLRPGDTLYFETDYAGKDASQWRYIDHAAIYVGNGLYLQTHGSGGKGAIGYGSYWAKNSSVKFIGRPCW